MSNLLELIKQAAVDAVNAQKPVDIRYGKVININPFRIRLNEKITLSGDFLCVLESYALKAKQGDTVAIMNVKGGQKYVVLDRVVKV